MENLLYLLKSWVRNATQLKNNCNVYYKNEKIFSCKNCTDAEAHIKRMYHAVSNRAETVDELHIKNSLHAEETANWKKFRNNFKLGNE